MVRKSIKSRPEGVFEGDTVAINPNDFKICGSCRHINLMSDSICRGCDRSFFDTGKSASQQGAGTIFGWLLIGLGGVLLFAFPFGTILGIFLIVFGWKKKDASSFHTIESASRPGVGTFIGWLMIVCGVVSLFAFPIGTILGIMPIIIGSKVLKASTLNAREKRTSFEGEAVDLLSALASEQKKEAESVYQAGLQAFGFESYETAITKMEQAIRLGASDRQGKYVLAASYYNRDQFDKCIPILKALVEDHAAPVGAAELLARAYVHKGVSAIDQLDFMVKQGTAFSQSLQDEIALACAKYCEEQADTSPNAVVAIERASQLEPNALTHVKALIAIAVKQENWPQGRGYGARLPIGQHDAGSIALYALCLKKAMDNSNEAVQVFRAQLGNHPEDSEIRLRCVEVFMAQKEFDQAENLLRDGVTEDPTDLRVRYHLALVYMMSGQIQDCIGELQQVLRTEGFESYRSKEEIYVLLARCFVRLGMLEAAMKQFLLAGRSEKHLDDLCELGLRFEEARDGRNARACWEEVYATDIRFKDVATRIGSAQENDWAPHP